VAPLALISFAVILRQVSETPTQAQRRLDPFGQLTSILAVTALTFGLIEGGVIGWHAPMLPLRLFANSTISVGFLAGALLNFVYSGLLFVLSLFFQQVRSYSPLLRTVARGSKSKPRTRPSASRSVV
jgi:DHA2 family methylenomycin A resistance protein-like MFS transporter